MTYVIEVRLIEKRKPYPVVHRRYALLKTNSAPHAETFVNELVDVANSDDFAERVTAERGETVDDRNSRAVRKARGAY